MRLKWQHAIVICQNCYKKHGHFYHANKPIYWALCNNCEEGR